MLKGNYMLEGEGEDIVALSSRFEIVSHAVPFGPQFKVFGRGYACVHA